MDSPTVDSIPDPPSPWKKRVVYAVIAVGVISIIGLAGQLSGAGWFGYRSFLYDNVDVYLLNMSSETKTVRIPGHDDVEVKANGAEIVTTIGGDIEVEVVGGTTHALSTGPSHVLVKLSKDGCLAATDITPYYGGKQPKDPKFDAFIKTDQETYVVGSKNVVWPRKAFPTRLSAGDGRGVWIELVGCELFEDRMMLDAYISFRLDERMKKAMEGQN